MTRKTLIIYVNCNCSIFWNMKAVQVGIYLLSLRCFLCVVQTSRWNSTLCSEQLRCLYTFHCLIFDTFSLLHNTKHLHELQIDKCTLLLYERTEFPLLRFGLIAKQTIILPTAHEFTIGNLKPGKKLCNGFICFTELLSNWLKTLLYSIIARELNLWVHNRPRAQQMWWGVLNIFKRHF